MLIGLPMEPAEYPRQDPGPETLLTTLDPKQNLDRLHWVMGRGTAYVGLVGIMGDRFTQQRDSLEPVLDEMKARGLLYVDDHDGEQEPGRNRGARAGHGMGRHRPHPRRRPDRARDREGAGANSKRRRRATAPRSASAGSIR